MKPFPSRLSRLKLSFLLIVFNLNWRMCSTQERWTVACSGGNFINITSETRRLASNIITRVLLGQKVDGTKLCDSINYINEYTLKTVLRNATKEEQAEYQKSLLIFCEETESILKENREIPLLGNAELSPAQKKALVFITFFAGQETTASLMNNTFYEIARNPETAQHLEEDSIDDFFVRSVHNFTPAYGIGRKLNSDICLEYTLE